MTDDLVAGQENPLAGLTQSQADAHVEYYAEKVERAEESLKTMKAHLKTLKSASKNLPPITGPSDDGTRVDAEGAESRIADQ